MITDKKTLYFLTTILTLAGFFPTEVFLPAFPEISKHFDCEVETISRSLSQGMIAFATGQIIFGCLLDSPSQKQIFLLGLGGSVIAAMGCLSASTYPFFLISRLSQFFFGAVFAYSVVLAQNSLPAPEAVALRLYNLTLNGVCASLAPLLGVCIVHWCGWRGIFGVYVCLMIIGIALSWLKIQKTSLPLSSRRKQLPFLATHISILSSPRFWYPTLLSALSYTCHFSFITLSASFFLKEGNYTQVDYGVALLGYGASYVVGGVIVRRLLSLHLFLLPAGSLLLMAVGGLIMVLEALPVTSMGIRALLPACVSVIGIAMIRPLSLTLSLQNFPTTPGITVSLQNVITFLLAGASGLGLHAFYLTTLPRFALVLFLYGLICLFLALKILRRRWQHSVS